VTVAGVRHAANANMAMAQSAVLSDSVYLPVAKGELLAMAQRPVLAGETVAPQL
jgi:hypothetical protein